MRYAIRHPCPALEPNGEHVQLVHIYVSFPGTTEEALRYYEKVFGTRIVALQTFGDIRAVSTGEQLPYLDRRQRQGRGRPRLRPPQRRGQGAHATCQRAMGTYFGMCVYRFGVQWIVSLPHPA